MMHLLSWAALFLFISSSGLASDDCSPIPNLAKNLGPVYNQHCTHWCSIFVAADLLTQEYQKKGLLRSNERLHPLSLAGSLFLDVGGDPSSANARNREFYPQQVLANIGRNRPNAKLCKETDLGFDMSLRNVLFTRSKRNTTGLRSEYSAAKKCHQQDKMIALEDEIHKISMTTWDDLLAKKCKIPPLKLENVSKPFYDKKREAELLGPKPIKENKIAADKMAKGIDKNLEQGKISAVLMDIDSFVDPKNNQITKECGPRAGGGLHWASVVQRRRDPDGVCEYRIRSSWGHSCLGFYRHQKCNKDGTFWLPREALTQRMADVDYIP